MLDKGATEYLFAQRRQVGQVAVLPKRFDEFGDRTWYFLLTRARRGDPTSRKTLTSAMLDLHMFLQANKEDNIAFLGTPEGLD